MKKLKDPAEPLDRLMTAASGLEEKLGPVLFQFPRQWRLNLERLDGFLPLLDAYRPTRFAFEFRHDTWLSPAVYQRLERAGCVDAEWRQTENARRAKVYNLTRAGRRQLAAETADWARRAGAVARLLGSEA